MMKSTILGKVKHQKCKCQFCKDYKRLKLVLPQVPKRHRKWIETFFETAWSIDEEFGYKSAILNGDWPSAVEQLEHALNKAKEIRKNILVAEKFKQIGLISSEDIK